MRQLVAAVAAVEVEVEAEVLVAAEVRELRQLNEGVEYLVICHIFCSPIFSVSRLSSMPVPESSPAL